MPVVDVGDDVFIIDDNDKTTWRLQIKSADCRGQPAGSVKAKFSGISRKQLRAELETELFFMFLMRLPDRWRFLVVPRGDLVRVRDRLVDTSKEMKKRGRPPKADDEAKGDEVGLEVTLTAGTTLAWGEDMAVYLDRWPTEIGVVASGPGTVSHTDSPGAAVAAPSTTTTTPELPLAPSQGPEK